MPSAARIKQLEAIIADSDRKEAIGLKAMSEYRQANLMEFFNKPKGPPDYGMPANPLQVELLDAWDNQLFKTFAYTGGNRCLGAEQLIYDPVKKESVPVSALPKRFHVYALDENGLIVISSAENPFRKGPVEPLYEVKFSSGKKVICSAGHRFLTPDGYRALSELSCGSQLYGSFPNEESCQSIHDEDDHRLNQKVEDLKRHYWSYLGRRDAQLLFPLNSDQENVPLQADAQEPSYHCDKTDDPGNRCKHNRQRRFDGHPSILDGLFLSAVRCAWSLSRVFCRFVKRVDCYTQSILQPVCGLNLEPQSIGGFYQLANHVFCKDYNRDFPFVPPVNVESSDTITTITYVRDDYKWDFTVPEHGNYLCGGVIHSNTGKTTILTIVAFSMAFGRWLWNDQRMYFPHSNPRKIRIIGQAWESHIKAVLIPEMKKWWPKKRKLHVKKNQNGVEYFWTDVKTGSTIEIMSNQQDPDMMEGWYGDGIFFDEPPKRDNRIACARGLIDRQGRELFAMTLLKEAWVDREVIKAVDENGKPDRTVFSVNGDIQVNVGYGITQEGVDQFSKSLTEDEKSARLHGKPSYLSGLVYPQFNRQIHMVERNFEVPSNWIVDIALDIHPRERQAVLFLATDERNERYGIEEIWAHGDGDAIADEILRRITRNNYRVGTIIIDPLSKSTGEAQQVDDNSTFKKIQRKLWRHDYPLIVASKDKTSGVLEIRNHLLGMNKKPSIWFFDDLVRVLFEFEGYMYKDGKIMDADDHMMENLYRLLLLDTKYVDPEDEWDEEDEEQPRNFNSVTGY